MIMIGKSLIFLEMFFVYILVKQMMRRIYQSSIHLMFLNDLVEIVIIGERGITP